MTAAGGKTNAVRSQELVATAVVSAFCAACLEKWNLSEVHNVAKLDAVRDVVMYFSAVAMSILLQTGSKSGAYGAQ